MDITLQLEVHIFACHCFACRNSDDDSWQEGMGASSTVARFMGLHYDKTAAMQYLSRAKISSHILFDGFPEYLLSFRRAG